MSEQEESSPHQVIENIRSNFLLDIETESASVRAGALYLQTQLNNALTLLSSDLYSKKSHFVLEIVQNADDNAYGVGVTPELGFDVHPHRMVVVNNELGFSQENVTAICSVGASSKSKDKTGYIGEKGIGFKSVFTVSDAPEIHSNGYHFRFDRTIESNLLGYVVPNWCPPASHMRSDCTTIILPARPGHVFEKTTLAELDARLLLFLNKLRQLTVVYEGATVTFARKEVGRVSYLTSTTTASDGKVTAQELRYLRVSQTFSISEDARDEKRNGISQSTVVLAFSIDETGAASPEPHSNVFAFLPIRPMGFQFPIQADFILSSSREELLTDRPWNQFLCEAIADTFAAAVEQFKEVKTLGLSYLRFVPAEGEVVDPFFQPLRPAILQQLRSMACLPSASGSWEKPDKLRSASMPFRALFPSSVAATLLGFDYVDPRMQGGSPLLRELGVRELTTDDIVSIFKSQSDWLSAQPLEWKARLYAYLADMQESLTKAGLLKVPSLPLSDGSFVVPTKTQAFFPLGRGKKYAFEHELVIIDHQLYDAACAHSAQVVSLFSAMGVRSDQPYDLVHSHLLPRYASDKWRSSEFTALVGHLRYIKDKLADYLGGAAAVGKPKASAFKELREAIWIGTKAVDNGTWRFNRADQLYLAKEYRAAFCIESLLAEPIDAGSYVSPDYMDSKASDQQAEAESWREFFAQLGIRQSPALLQIGADWHCSDELHALLHSTQTSVRRATLECLSSHWEHYADRVTYQSPQGRQRFVTLDSHFIRTLRASAAPLRGRATVALSATYYFTPELKALLGDGLPYVDARLASAMLDACGITHRVDARGLIKRLKYLKQGNGTTLKQTQAIYRALDDRFWESDGRMISDALESDALVLVKGEHKGWFSPSALTWRASRPFLENLFPPIQSQYRDFGRFFLDRLHVPRELPTTSWVDAIQYLDRIEDIQARQAEAQAIYRKVNGDLKPRFGREVELPDWISTFQDDEVFINQRGELVANNALLMVNDAPEFGDLFLDDEDLSYVAVPLMDIPRLSRLFDAAQVARLSGSIAVHLINDASGDCDTHLTARMRRAYPYIARILYSTHPDVFERALQSGAMHSIRSLSIHAAPEVRLQVILGERVRETTAEAAIAHGRFIYRTGTSSVKDRLAVELGKALEAPPESADAFARLLLEDEPQSIEDFFNVRGIGPLPVDLLAAINADNDGDNDPAVDDGAPLADEVSESDADAPFISEGSDELTPQSHPAVLGEALQNSGIKHNPVSPPASAGPGATDNQAPVNDRGERPSLPVPGSAPATGAQPSAVAPATAAGTVNPETTASAQGHDSRVVAPPAPSEDPVATPAPSTKNAGLAGVEAPSQAWSTPAATPRSSPLGANGSHWNSPATYTPGDATMARTQGSSPRTPTLASTAPRTKSGRLLSYVQGPVASGPLDQTEGSALAAARSATGRAAVTHFLETQTSRWASLTEMPHNNPGFDILAEALDGQDEYIEVKGQSGAWTQEGVALTPRELITAHEKRERYWLCIVEYAHDEKRRQMYLVQDPFGLTDQFRFDVGWKDACEHLTAAPARPEKDLYIDLAGDGPGRIISVRERGRFFNLHVILRGGRQVNCLFNPAKMTLSKEPLWQE
ncbi:DUF3883 domain-containing protein [Variovorax sp. 38R]|uniref:DUF3883 domain-containing protein n=1 Tax=Variovorax sp. 38R TaxID=2774875 RepID=UPI0017825A8A|nr:DUF3883 domain-containing protein [Variovorax sp. 38R]QOF76171.1 DUF3883 domain-containing protein [Variovorax sp. 38R]